jgi:hypothetical protein
LRRITFLLQFATYSLVNLPPLSSLNNRNSLQPTFYDIKAAEFESFSVNVTDVLVKIKFEPAIPEDKAEILNLEVLYLDKIHIEDRKGNRYKKKYHNILLSTTI